MNENLISPNLQNSIRQSNKMIEEMLQESMAPIRESLKMTSEIIQNSMPKIEIPNYFSNIDLDSLIPKIDLSPFYTLNNVLNETHKHQLGQLREILRDSLTTVSIEHLQEETDSKSFDEELISTISSSFDNLEEVFSSIPEAESLKEEVKIIRKSFTENITIEKIITWFTFIDFMCKLIGIPSPFDTSSQVVNIYKDVNIEMIHCDSIGESIEISDITPNSEMIE